MRNTGPRNKLARREGKDLGLKTTGSNAQASLLRRINIRPGQKPNTRYRKLTGYGKQLRAKQTIRHTYGLTESKLRRYFDEAVRMPGNTAHNLVQLLEMRLDNVVYRLGFAPTRPAARQLVNHAHFELNGEKVSIPSINTNAGDVITFRKKSTTNIPYVKEMLDKEEFEVPEWLERKAKTGKVADKPGVEVIGDDYNLQDVIEFYSR